MLGRAHLGQRASFSRSWDTTNRATTNATRAKCKVLVKPVVQLVPLAVFDQLNNARSGPVRQKVGTGPLL